MRYVDCCQCSHSMSIILALPHLWVSSISNVTKSEQFADVLRKIKHYHHIELS